MGNEKTDYDAIVIGAGFAGLYAVYRFTKQGLDILGLEGAPNLGGVWYHNRYPGARCDVESLDYCYYFSEDLYREWKWSERYASQPEILRYLNHVADRFDIRRHFLFSTWMTGAQWYPEEARYHVRTQTGKEFTCRFLIMATGSLSDARVPPFEGLDRFQGECVQTAHWPDREVKIQGRRIGIIGTGSSGVQTVPAIAPVAEHVYLFQRTAGFSVVAQNGPLPRQWEDICANVPEERASLLKIPTAMHRVRPARSAMQCTPAERQTLLEQAWARGGHGMIAVFTDQLTDKTANDVASEFVRSKIRSIVKDPVVAEKLCPYDHPMGSRRLIVDTDYYASFNRNNVTLVDIAADPIECLTENGIKTRSNHYEIDLLILALGFNAYKGAIEKANIRNEHGQSPTDHWGLGARTLLGLMTSGFPNLFIVAGPGSPATAGNLLPQIEFGVDWIADCIAYLDKHGKSTIEPEEEAEDKWTSYVNEVAKKLLLYEVKNYKVQVNEDGSRAVFPFFGGVDRYVEHARAVAAKEYEGFRIL
jgi:cation diffusion facilitator CzcD-associated flavoprotein CzcO